MAGRPHLRGTNERGARPPPSPGRTDGRRTAAVAFQRWQSGAPTASAALLRTVVKVDKLVSLGVDSASLNPAIALSTMQGRLTLHVAAILAEIGRHLIAPRVRAGLAATRAQGTVLRRPRKAVDPWSSPNSARKAAHGPRRLAGCESLRAARARVLSSDRVRTGAREQ